MDSSEEVSEETSEVASSELASSLVSALDSCREAELSGGWEVVSGVLWQAASRHSANSSRRQVRSVFILVYPFHMCFSIDFP